MPDPDRTDAEIIDASLTDPEHFEEIFRRHHSALYRYALRRVGVADAADVVAEVFVRALAVRSRYDLSRENCLPWLHGIAANLAGDRLRKLRRGRLSFASAPPSPGNDPTEDSDNRVVAEGLSPLVNDALATVSEADRKTFLLFALEELTYSEIAGVLAIPPGTVGSRITRVREKILETIPDLAERLEGSA